MTASSTAAATVFAIPELLENILLHVDPFQLYVLQAANNTFRSVITDFKTIRQRMHLEQSKLYIKRRELRHFLRDERITAVAQPFSITWHPACLDDLDVELSCDWTQEQEKKYWFKRFWNKDMRCMRPGSSRGIRVGQPEIFPADKWDCIKTIDICGSWTEVEGETLGAVVTAAVGILWRKPGRCTCSFSKWIGSSRDGGLDCKIPSESTGWCAVM